MENADEAKEIIEAEQSLGEPNELKTKNVAKVIATPRRCRFRLLGHVVIMLQKLSKHPNDAAYWRSVALSRGEQIDRSMLVIDLQRKRIDCLEKDLTTLMQMAQETHQVLIDLAGPD